MPTYITLMKLTEQGSRTSRRPPGRVEEGTRALEAVGGKLIGLYAVMGEYDYVAVSEAPSDEDAVAFNLGLGSLGNVRTTTLKAFNKEEFAGIVGKLP